MTPFLIYERGVTFLNEDERIKVNWGGFSQVRCELELLKKAYTYPSINFDYFHLLSGHDFPCATIDQFDTFFERVTPGRSFMHFDTPDQHKDWSEQIEARINKWHLADTFVGKTSRIRRFIEAFLNRMFPRSFPLELYAGWQWFSWHRSLVMWVLSYCDCHPDYLRRFHNTGCCDEVLFHTMLHPHIDELNIDINNALRYIDWFPDRPYKTLPLILDERDYDKIVKSGCLFCRKVKMPDSNTLCSKLENNKV